MAFFLNEDSIKSKDQYVIIFSFFIGLIFLILLHLAMFIYPDGFDLINYFLSDLGRQTALNGDNNPTASILFTLSMFLGALFLFVFWLISPILLKPYDSKFYIFVQIGAILGLLSSLLMALIGIFPTDTQSDIHNLIGILFFSFAGISMLLYSIFFIHLFFTRLKEENRLTFAIITSVIVILFSLLVTTFLSEFPSFVVVLAVFGLFVFIGLLKLKFPHFIEMMSFLVSIFMIVLIVMIVFLLLGTGLIAIFEVSFVYAMIIWILVNNSRIFLLSLEND